MELTHSYSENKINFIELGTWNFQIIFQSVLSKLGDLGRFSFLWQILLHIKETEDTFAYVT